MRIKIWSLLAIMATVAGILGHAAASSLEDLAFSDGAFAGPLADLGAYPQPASIPAPQSEATAISAPQEVELILKTRLDPQDPKHRVGQILVPCNFDGHSTQCILDTGSNRSMVREAGFSTNYPAIDSWFTTGISGKSIPMSIVNVPDFRLGTIALGKRHFDRYPSESHGGSKVFDETIEGLIGMDILSFARLDLTFGARNTMSLGGPELAQTGARPLVITHSRKIFIPVTLGSSEITAFWDTGFGLTMVEHDYVVRHPSEFTLAQEVKSFDIAGATVIHKVYKANSIVIAGQTFSDEYVMESHFLFKDFGEGQDFMMVLGYNILTRLNWHMDLKNKRWSVERVSE